MWIFLGIVLEINSILGYFALTINSTFNGLINVAKSGYKINKEKFDEIQKNNKPKKKKSLIVKILSTLCVLLPGINLIAGAVAGHNVKKAIMDELKATDSLTPLTEEEKKEFAKLKSKKDKLAFMAHVMTKKNDEEEFVGFIGKRPLIVDHGLLSVYFSKLPELDYTFDEVKRLNEATTFTYRIGTMDDKNVAIIGIPNPDKLVNRLEFEEENYEATHDFIKMTEEEANDKTFTVYPFYSNVDEKLLKVVEEIRQSRSLDEAKPLDTSLELDGPTLKRTKN